MSTLNFALNQVNYENPKVLPEVLILQTQLNAWKIIKQKFLSDF